MANLSLDQKLGFDTELSISATTFTGAAQLVGALTNVPVKLLIKNLTSVQVFFADNPGGTKGTTMAAGEEIVLDCKLESSSMSTCFPIGTSFFVTGAAGTGVFKVSVLYAF